MADFNVITRRQVLAAAAAAALVPTTSAFAADSIKMSLEFRIYGGNAPMFLENVFQTAWAGAYARRYLGFR